MNAQRVQGEEEAHAEKPALRIFIMGGCVNWEAQLGSSALLIGFRELLRTQLPTAEIATSFSLSARFCRDHDIVSVPRSRLSRVRIINWIEPFASLAASGLWRACRSLFGVDLKVLRKLKLVDEYLRSDIVVDLSGDTYGDAVQLRGFVRHSLSLLTARLLGKAVVAVACSPGPFRTIIRRAMGKGVLNRLTLITTREPVSADRLKEMNIRTPYITTACPAYHLQPAKRERVREILEVEGVGESMRPLAGLTLCGYNLYSHPTWDTPRDTGSLGLYIPMMMYLLEDLGAHVLLVPHVYRINPWTGQFVQGPDYVIGRSLIEMVGPEKYGERLRLLQGTYSPAEVKGVIGSLDLFVAGRLHAGVAALSQGVPTVLLAYGPKHRGFAMMLGQEEYVWEGRSGDELASVVRKAWSDRDQMRMELRARVPLILDLAALNVKMLHDILSLGDRGKNRLPRKLVEHWAEQGWESQSGM